MHRGSHGEVDVNVCSAASQPRIRPLRRARPHRSLRRGRRSRSRRGPNRAGRPSATPRSATTARTTPRICSRRTTRRRRPTASGQTVAIVDAYDAPNVDADLAVYRTHVQPAAVHDRERVLPEGRPERRHRATRRATPSWAQETTLDVQMVSALCPNCHILLVEANTTSLTDLGASGEHGGRARRRRREQQLRRGRVVGDDERSTDHYFDHPGVAIVASSGDTGYGVSYPAASPHVVAVGGTTPAPGDATRARATRPRRCGRVPAAGAARTSRSPRGRPTPAARTRTVADVSAVADPTTGVWVYDSDAAGGWSSAGRAWPRRSSARCTRSPATRRRATDMSSLPYATPSALNDVVSGSNGSCGGTYLCTGVAGYDGPTGLGTPNGAAAFAPGGVVGAPSSPSNPPFRHRPPTSRSPRLRSAQCRPGATAKSTVTVHADVRLRRQRSSSRSRRNAECRLVPELHVVDAGHRRRGARRRR